MLSRGREDAGHPNTAGVRRLCSPPTPPPPVPPWVAEKASRRTPELPFRDPGAGPAAFWLEAESWWLSAPGSLMADDGSQKGQGPRCLSGPQPLQVPSGLAEPRAHSPEHPTPAPFSPEDRRGLRAPGVALDRLLSRTEDLVQSRTVSSVLLGKRGRGQGRCRDRVAHTAAWCHTLLSLS